ncbi:MAG: hypothetical protein ACE14L_06840 [Terriglobales bacterium]
MPQYFRLLPLALLLLVAVPALSASDPNDTVTPNVPAPPAAPGPSPIQDNSFLVEEAYNQEDGVVQHISFFNRIAGSWAYSFTQEWPAGGLKHQLSYTLQAVRNADFGKAGAGDVLINYRYQLAGSGESRFAFSPRVGLIAPVGSATAGRGYGGWGTQINLPVSFAVNKRLVTHWNAGGTLVPRAQNEFGARAFSTGYNLGQSFIWQAHPRFNVMLETAWLGYDRVTSPGRTQRSHDLYLSPGVRWAHDLPGGLQIVPGVGVPLGIGPSSGQKGILLYLSFEHPFRSTSRK